MIWGDTTFVHTSRAREPARCVLEVFLVLSASCAAVGVVKKQICAWQHNR